MIIIIMIMIIIKIILWQSIRTVYKFHSSSVEFICLEMKGWMDGWVKEEWMDGWVKEE